MRGLPDAVAGNERDPGGPTAQIDRGEAGVHGHDPNIFQRDAQLLGRNHGKHGGRALPYIRRACKYGRRAVLEEIDIRGGEIPVVVDFGAAHVDHTGDPYACILFRVRLPLFPAQLLGGLDKTPPEPVARNPPTGNRRFPGIVTIPQSEIQLVDAQPISDHIHLGFYGKGHLRASVAPERPPELFVRIDQVGLHPYAGDPVMGGGCKSGISHDRRPHVIIGSVIYNHLEMPGRQGAVLLYPCFEGDDHRMAGPGRRKFFLPAEGDLHRPSSFSGKQGADRFIFANFGLGPKPPSDRDFHDPHLGDGHIQNNRKFFLDKVGALGRSPYGQVFVQVKEGDGPMRLHAAMRNGLGAEAIFEDMVGAAEGLVHVPVIAKTLHDDVAFPMDLRGIRAHRQFRIKNRGKLFVDNFDQPQGLFSRIRGVGRHCGHLIPHVSYLIGGQDKLVLEGGAHMNIFDLRRLLCRDNGLHPRDLLGFRGIDTEDFRMSMGAAEDLSDQHSRQRDVCRVPGRSRHFFQRIDSRKSFPHHGKLYHFFLLFLPGLDNKTSPQTSRSTVTRGTKRSHKASIFSSFQPFISGPFIPS